MEKTCKNCNKVYRTESDFFKGTSRWRMCSLGNLWFECGCKSTLMLLKGKFDWYSPDKFMSPGAAEIFNRLGGMKDLPHIPHTVMQLLTLLQDESVKISDLVREVKKEPFIANDIYKIATNLRASRSSDERALENLEHAIVYVGLATVKDLLITASLKQFAFKVEHFSTEIFWREAHITAGIAEFVSRKVRYNHPDEAYLAGLLLNMGKLVGAICLPQETDRVYAATKDRKKACSWLQAEKSIDATSHVTLGEIGAAIWGFPVFITEAITAHHQLKAVAAMALRARPPELYHIATLANQMAHWILLQPERIDDEILHKSGEELGFSKQGLDRLAEDLSSLKEDKAAA